MNNTIHCATAFGGRVLKWLPMGALAANLGILPQSQQQLWPRLSATPQHFVLYGGTALALRLGHRESVDFDFFSCRSFQPAELFKLIPYLDGQTVTQTGENTLSCDIDVDRSTVKISFFGGLSLGQIEAPDRAEGNSIAVASLIDLLGMKCATIPQRSEAKDYLDVDALLTRTKLSLAQGIAAARAIYGRQYNPVLTLQALSYFDDLPEPLPESVKANLTKAVKSVSLQQLPTVTAAKAIGEVSEPVEP